MTRNDSLLASETERCQTSKSLYGDHKARVSANVGAISDHTRNHAYLGFLRRCARGKSVLHLGCGIGLWSMVAAKAGATTVTAVDTSTIVHSAQVVAQQNKLTAVQFLQGKVRDGTVKLPHEKYDIIVCDWIAQFGTNDSLFKEFMFCVINHLAPGGITCPNQCTMSVSAITDYPYYQDTVHFWDNVYGFQMKPMQPLVTAEPTTGSIPKNQFVTMPCQLATKNVTMLAASADAAKLLRASPAAAVVTDDDAAYAALCGYDAPFRLLITRKSTVHFLTFFVDCQFTNSSTDAAATGSNFVIGFQQGGRNEWTEVSAFLPEPLPVVPGDVIEGHVKVQPRGSHTELTLTVKCRNALIQHESTTQHRFQY